MQATEKTVPTSLKLPADVKLQIDDAARADGLSPHAYMVRVLQKDAERRRLRAQFHQDALVALREVEETGLGHEWADVRAHFAQMAEHRAGRAEKPAPLVPKKLS